MANRQERSDLTGMSFGKLTVIMFDSINKSRNSVWLCECECGKRVLRTTSRLRKVEPREGCNRCNTNKFVDKGEYYLGITANGDEFLFDKEDYEKVSQYSWFFTKGYPHARKPHIGMHNFLMGKPPRGYEYDHINRNPADNRKSNLRLSTRSQNSSNRPGKNGTLSKYKGVTWCNKKNLWKATIGCGRKVYTICYSKSEEKCALEYNKKAIELHGEFAYLNTIDKTRA